ncbi:hypothetical protein CDL15_Pgr002573 [Punica granatum]|uniref:Uncharacterized protein n=1 Tax=Punica granatum TaxID=22663 RepID=A0A218WNW4_PUNGR|nr:hypothetical protein CDL15_Pgr002573 [Punica granatum]
MLGRPWVLVPEGGVELEDARFGPLSRANNSAMLVVMFAANWLTVPSSAAMRAWSSEVDDISETHWRGTPEDVGSRRCVEGAPKYVGSTPARVGGGGAHVGGGRECAGVGGLTSSEISMRSSSAILTR